MLPTGQRSEICDLTLLIRLAINRSRFLADRHITTIPSRFSLRATDHPSRFAPWEYPGKSLQAAVIPSILSNGPCADQSFSNCPFIYVLRHEDLDLGAQL